VRGPQHGRRRAEGQGIDFIKPPIRPKKFLQKFSAPSSFGQSSAPKQQIYIYQRRTDNLGFLGILGNYMS
jgi:hypothetical protein